MHLIDDNNEFILKDSYNFEYVKPEEESVPAYVLRKLKDRTGTTTGVVNAITGEKTLYSDFENLSRRVASGLHKNGFRKGDTLIFASDQPAKLHVFLLGAWRANAILRASYPEDHGAILLDRIIESQAKWIICDAENARAILLTIEKAPWEVSVIVFGSCPNKCISVETFFEDDGLDCPSLELKRDDVAAVMATSGTTGKSKGVVYTHERLLANMHIVMGLYRKGDGTEPYLHLGRTTHATSLQLLEFAASGQALIRLPMRYCAPERVLQAIHDYKPFGMSVIGPYMMKIVSHPSLADYDVSSVELVGLMGCVNGPGMMSAIKNFPSSPSVTNIYGTTETLSLSYGTVFSLEKRKKVQVYDLPPFATGKLVPGVMMAVRDEAGNILGPGNEGELWFKSRYTSIRYLNNQVETDKSFQNGWIRTGDLGYYDSNGFVYVVERLKEVFHYFGNLVSPSEIEDVLNQHPAVAEACVIAVPEPNGGDLMSKAFVILRNSSEGVTAEDLIKFSNSHFPVYKHLHGGLEIKDKFPYSPGGKLQRHLLN